MVIGECPSMCYCTAAAARRRRIEGIQGELGKGWSLEPGALG